jgi:hypothetical protein
MRDHIAVLGVGHLGLPQQVAALGVQRNDVRVQRSHKQRLTQDGETAIHLSAAVARLRQVSIQVGPNRPSRLRVQCHDVVRRLDGIKNAVHHDRCRLELFDRTRLPQPSHLQTLDVLRRDLG